MTKYDTSIETIWKKNDVIRDVKTGHPYLVVHVYQHVCTMVVDLEGGTPLTQIFSILPKDYRLYAPDKHMDDVKKNGMVQWIHNPMRLAL